MEEPIDLGLALENILNEELRKARIETFQPVRDAFEKYNISPMDRVEIMMRSRNETFEHFNAKNQIPEENDILKVTLSNINKFKNKKNG